jgi:hypothetical protein
LTYAGLNPAEEEGGEDAGVAFDWRNGTEKKY